MKIKDFGVNLIPTMDVTCEYACCGATVELVPADVKAGNVGWTLKFFWTCPRCGHTHEIPKENVSHEFMEEMSLIE